MNAKKAGFDGVDRKTPLNNDDGDDDFEDGY